MRVKLMTVQSSMESAGSYFVLKKMKTYWPLYTVRVSKPRKITCEIELVILKSV